MNLKSKCFVLALGHRSAATPLRAVGLALALSVLAGQAQSAELPVVAVQSAQRAQTASYDGQVEALRQAVIAAQDIGKIINITPEGGKDIEEAFHLTWQTSFKR